MALLGENRKVRVCIIGSAGYTGGELIRLLINHPNAEIVFAHSGSNAGKSIASVHNDLFGDTDLVFSDILSDDIDVMFLCVGHGNARVFLENNVVADHIKIIDLSQDFRLEKNSVFQNKEFVYGLPELQREKIKQAGYIANPGCFASNIELALLPLGMAGKLQAEVHVNATTGSTGAGQQPTTTSHFSWRDNNLSVYKAFNHQHLNEIGETLSKKTNIKPKINFIPQRGAFPRGIFSSIYLPSELTLEEAYELYESYYESHPFTHVSKENIDLKQVVNTNKCLLHLEKHDGYLFIISILDNLLKGASGVAVQNMNLLFGLEESAGLRLKASAF
jgi:N-acetyl-gamma-glutamyl-phosphate reductase